MGQLTQTTNEVQQILDTVVTNPMTAQGDLIIGGANGTPTRLPKGSTAGQVLVSNGSTLDWGTPGGGGGGGGGGSSSGGGGGNEPSASSLPKVSTSPRPSMTPLPTSTVKPTLKPVATPGTTVTPKPSATPVTTGQSSDDGQTVKNYDDNGNLVSTTTTETKTLENGATFTSVKTVFTDGSSIEKTKTDYTNGDVLVTQVDLNVMTGYVNSFTLFVPVEGHIEYTFEKQEDIYYEREVYRGLGGNKIAITQAHISGGSVRYFTIPGTVSVIGNDFVVTEIGNYAFSSMSIMGSMALNDSIVFVGDGAFQNNKNMSSFTTGKGLKRIGTKACYGNKKLKTITILSKKLSYIGNNAFSKINKKATFYISGNKKRFKKTVKLIKQSGGLPKKVRFKRK